MNARRWCAVVRTDRYCVLNIVISLYMRRVRISFACWIYSVVSDGNEHYVRTQYECVQVRTQGDSFLVNPRPGEYIKILNLDSSGKSQKRLIVNNVENYLLFKTEHVFQLFFWTFWYSYKSSYVSLTTTVRSLTKGSHCRVVASSSEIPTYICFRITRVFKYLESLLRWSLCMRVSTPVLLALGLNERQHDCSTSRSRGLRRINRL